MNRLNPEHSFEHQLEQLPKEMEPQRDLWPGIEKALALTPQQSKKKSAVVPMAWAASVVVAIMVSWLSFAPQQGVVPETMNLAQMMQQDFQQQKQLMLASFGQPELSNLPKEMQEQLNELAAARSTISKALANDPENSELLNLLRWTQKQEIELIRRLYAPQWQTI